MLKKIKSIFRRKTPPAPTVEAPTVEAPTVEAPPDPAKIQAAIEHRERTVAQILSEKSKLAYLPGRAFGKNCQHDHLALTRLIIINHHRTDKKTMCEADFTPCGETGEIYNVQPVFTLKIDDCFAGEARSQVFQTVLELIKRYFHLSMSGATALPSNPHQHIKI